MVVTKDIISRVEFEQKDVNLFYNVYADTDLNASEYKITVFKSQTETDSQRINHQIILMIKEQSDEEPASSSIEVFYVNNYDNNPKFWSVNKIVRGLSKDVFILRLKEILEDNTLRTWSKSIFGEYLMFSIPSAAVA